MTVPLHLLVLPPSPHPPRFTCKQCTATNTFVPRCSWCSSRDSAAERQCPAEPGIRFARPIRSGSVPVPLPSASIARSPLQAATAPLGSLGSRPEAVQVQQRRALFARPINAFLSATGTAGRGPVLQPQKGHELVGPHSDGMADQSVIPIATAQVFCHPVFACFIYRMAHDFVTVSIPHSRLSTALHGVINALLFVLTARDPS